MEVLLLSLVLLTKRGVTAVTALLLANEVLNICMEQMRVYYMLEKLAYLLRILI